MVINNEIFQELLFKTVVFERLLTDYKVETIRCERDLMQQKLREKMPETNQKERHEKKKALVKSYQDLTAKLKKAEAAKNKQYYLNDLKKSTNPDDIERVTIESARLFSDFTACVIRALENNKTQKTHLVACCLETCEEKDAMIKIADENFLVYVEKATPYDNIEDDE